MIGPGPTLLTGKVATQAFLLMQSGADPTVVSKMWLVNYMTMTEPEKTLLRWYFDHGTFRTW